jgi:hypothetical protein
LSRCIRPNRRLLSNHAQPSRSRERNAVSTRPRDIISSLKPTKTPSPTRESRKAASNCDQSVLTRLTNATTTMMTGATIGQRRGERRRSKSAGRHQPSAVAVMTRSRAPTPIGRTAPLKVASADLPISGYGTPPSLVMRTMVAQ